MGIYLDRGGGEIDVRGFDGVGFLLTVTVVAAV